MKKALSMLLVMVMTLACLSGAAMADSDKYLGVMLSTNVMSLDTNLATDGESFEVIADCIDGLMQMDAAGASIPALAESYDMSEDGLTYTFHLRDAKWSNGIPVTASDFVFAWRRICKEAGEYAYMFGSSVGCVKGAQDIIDGKATMADLEKYALEKGEVTDSLGSGRQEMLEAVMNNIMFSL